MDAVQPIENDDARSTAPAVSAARTIRVVGLALALGYLVVLTGTFLRGEFLTDA